MPHVNQLGGLVRGADGVLYRVSTGTCEPLPDTRDDGSTADAGGAHRRPGGTSHHVAARSHIDPGDHAAARIRIEPGDHAAARIRIEPGEAVTSTA